MAIERKYGKVTTEKGSIHPEEPVIIFRGQDKYASAVVRFYATLVASHGDVEMAKEAHKTADALEAWPKKKTPTW